MKSLNHILGRALPAALSLLLLCGFSSDATGNTNGSTVRTQLHQNRFIELPLGSISADGWLKEMLLRQKSGATGHLDELYPCLLYTSPSPRD